MDLKQQLDKVIDEIKSKITDFTPVLHLIASFISSRIDENFASGGRVASDLGNISIFSGGSNKWVERSPHTLKMYKKSKRGITPTLHRTGVLHDSIEVKPQPPNKILITVGTPYGLTHQFGRTQKLGERIVNIPARPFITLAQEDVEDIIDIIKSHL